MNLLTMVMENDVHYFVHKLECPHVVDVTEMMVSILESSPKWPYN